jgi:signal transduction histidine kinase
MSQEPASDAIDVPVSERRDRESVFSGTCAQERRAGEHRAGGGRELSSPGDVAHDFRNILTLIDSGLRLLACNGEDPRKRDQIIAGIRSGIGSGIQLASRLLNVAKEPHVRLEAVDPNQVLRSIEPLLKYCVRPELRVVFDFGEGIPKCRMNPLQFHAAIFNLVGNARDAMPRGGEIRISTSTCVIAPDGPKSLAPGRYVRVRIRDDGIGMSEDLRRRIFEARFTTKGENGAGLGLPQVEASMRRLGGAIKLTSKLGRGTTVDLLFPIAEQRVALRGHEASHSATMVRKQDSADPKNGSSVLPV